MGTNKYKLNAILMAVMSIGITLSPLTSQAVIVNNVGLDGAPGENGGDRTADAGFSIPNSDSSNSATSKGGAGVPGSTNGGNSQAVAATTGNTGITAFTSATGGTGGSGWPYDLASGISNAGGSINVKVFQTGGSGARGIFLR